MEMDRISSLPDLILSQILSYLHTDEVVRTKILSKQWQHLWFPTHELVFRETSEGPYSPYSYLTGLAKFIDRTLPLDNCENITKYDLTLISKGYFSQSDVDLGVKAAILRGVRHVILDFPGSAVSSSYTLSKRLCSYTSLESLTLRHRCKLSSAVCWTSLKALTIESIYLCNTYVNYILDGCPKLENLELIQCYGFDRIYANYESCLRRLVVIQIGTNLRYSNHMSLVLSIPNVECMILKLKGRLTVIAISSLVDFAVDFYFWDSDPYFSEFDFHYSKKNSDCDWLLKDEKSSSVVDRRKFLLELLDKVRHAEIVRLGPWCVKGISSFIMRKLPSSASLLKCKCLVLETPLDGWDIPGIVSLLRSTPHLETLVIDLTIGTDRNEQLSTGTKIGAVNAKTYWKKQDNFPLQHLKYVRIVGLATRLFGVAQFLLQNAKFLEKMELTKCIEKNDPSLVIQKIMQLPRSSPIAQVLIS